MGIEINGPLLPLPPGLGGVQQPRFPIGSYQDQIYRAYQRRGMSDAQAFENTMKATRPASTGAAGIPAMPGLPGGATPYDPLNKQTFSAAGIPPATSPPTSQPPSWSWTDPSTWSFDWAKNPAVMDTGEPPVDEQIKMNNDPAKTFSDWAGEAIELMKPWLTKEGIKSLDSLPGPLTPRSEFPGFMGGSPSGQPALGSPDLPSGIPTRRGAPPVTPGPGMRETGPVSPISPTPVAPGGLPAPINPDIMSAPGGMPPGISAEPPATGGRDFLNNPLVEFGLRLMQAGEPQAGAVRGPSLFGAIAQAGLGQMQGQRASEAAAADRDFEIWKVQQTAFKENLKNEMDVLKLRLDAQANRMDEAQLRLEIEQSRDKAKAEMNNIPLYMTDEQARAEELADINARHDALLQDYGLATNTNKQTSATRVIETKVINGKTFEHRSDGKVYELP